MKLYSYQYLTHNSDRLNYLLIILGLIIGISIIVIALKYSKDRTNLKFRNLLIVMFAFAAMVICLAVGKLQTQASTKNDSGQIARIMKHVAKDHHLSVKQVYTSSPTISKNLVLKADREYYQVNINSSNAVYSIKKVHPIADHVKYVNHGGINLSLNNSIYLTVACKLLIGFVMLVMQINLSGKSNLDPSNAVDELQNYVLGGIVGGTVFNPGITLLQFIVIILIWTIIIFGSKVLIGESNTFKRMLDGTPKVLIEKGRIDVDTALKNDVSADSLVFKLNNSGINNLQAVSKVTLEQNGELKIDNYPNTSTNWAVITDGNINQDILEHLHKSTDWLLKLLKSQHHQVKDVYLGQIVNDHDLVLTLYPKRDTRLLKFLPNQIIQLKKMFNKK